jgi:hypothetical protein
LVTKDFEAEFIAAFLAEKICFWREKTRKRTQDHPTVLAKAKVK